VSGPVRRPLLFLFVICAAVFIFFPVAANAQALPGFVRVGLTGVNGSGVIKISNGTVSFGYGDNDGAGFIGSAEISGELSAGPADFYYVRIDQYFSDYNSARASAEFFIDLGYEAAVGLIDNGVFAVYLGGYGVEADAAAEANWRQAPLVAPDGRRTALFDGGRAVLIFDNPSKHGRVAGVDGELISIGERRYRGVIELCRNGGAGVTAVNVLGTEDYLCGVVASEMLLGNIEAIKAQAVACRSYYCTQRGVHGPAAYDVCDAPHCQHYLGVEKETADSIRAVMETAGVMAYYNGEVINATYFSSSGGVTANSEDVWANRVPYLRAVTDNYETTGKVWERSFTLGELTELLNKNDARIGNATGVSAESDVSGRVARLTITGTNGSHTLEKEEIRYFFLYSDGGYLESRNFTMAGGVSGVTVYTEIFIADGGTIRGFSGGELYALGAGGTGSAAAIAPGSAVDLFIAGTDQTRNVSLNARRPAASVSTSSGDSVVFYGRGYGHGVGLSQHGAHDMAAAGVNFHEILKHYYTGIEIR